MISCATEDYSNDAEHLAMITGINTTLKCIETENSYFTKSFFPYVILYCILY